jgi:hypothetical protein
MMAFLLKLNAGADLLSMASVARLFQAVLVLVACTAPDCTFDGMGAYKVAGFPVPLLMCFMCIIRLGVFLPRPSALKAVSIWATANCFGLWTCCCIDSHVCGCPAHKLYALCAVVQFKFNKFRDLLRPSLFCPRNCISYSSIISHHTISI